MLSVPEAVLDCPPTTVAPNALAVLEVPPRTLEYWLDAVWEPLPQLPRTRARKPGVGGGKPEQAERPMFLLLFLVLFLVMLMLVDAGLDSG